MARIWFVTGSSKGLGRSVVEAALEDGDSVVATGLHPEALDGLVERYGADRVMVLALDVSDSNQVESAVNEGLAKFGRLDVVVNNAGYASPAALEDTSIQSFRAQIDVNLLGVVYVSKAVLPALRKQGSGRIIQVSSVGARLATPGLAAYQAAKWAVVGFSGVLQNEVAPFGIKVTTVEPGGMKTNWAGSPDDAIFISDAYKRTVGEFQKIRKQYEAYRTEPDTVAQAILKISKVPEPPLRLLLGPETVHLAKQASAELAASDEKWQAATVFAA